MRNYVECVWEVIYDTSRFYVDLDFTQQVFHSNRKRQRSVVVAILEISIDVVITEELRETRWRGGCCVLPTTVDDDRRRTRLDQTTVMSVLMVVCMYRLYADGCLPVYDRWMDMIDGSMDAIVIFAIFHFAYGRIM